MPELPEVETIARGVHERVRGDRIVHVWFGGHREPFKTPPARQAKGLEGRVLLGVHRTGKHIVCELGPALNSPRGSSPAERKTKKRTALTLRDAGCPEAQWIVHLGMTGRLLVTTPEAPLAAHTHARLGLASGRELRFVDPRRFGRLNSAISASESAARRLHRGRRRAPDHWADRFAALFRSRQSVHQGRPAEPGPARRSGQHLRRREPVSRRHPAAEERRTADQGRT